MKRKHLLSGALALGVLLGAAPGAYARTEITCVFSWADNPELNVKGHSAHAATLKKVRTKEYERLVGKKVAARISGSRGGKCTLNHPENTTIELQITKDEFRLDPAGAIPSCEALAATVECRGMESPEN
jgi:hypothetical protein